LPPQHTPPTPKRIKPLFILLYDVIPTGTMIYLGIDVTESTLASYPFSREGSHDENLGIIFLVVGILMSMHSGFNR